MTENKYITVDEVVRSVLGDEGKSTTHEYLRYLEIANRGLKQLTFDVLGSTKVALIPIGTSLRANLPVDYVDYTYVGIVGSDGKLHYLSHKGDIPVTGTDNTTPAPSEESYYWNGGLYGLGGGQNKNGYYKPQIDIESWQMIFTSTEVNTYVYLEYVSDGRAEGGRTIVHPYCEEALISWTYWKSIQKKRSYSRGDKMDARSDFYNEKRLAVARMKSFTKEEALTTIRKGFKQSPRL